MIIKSVAAVICMFAIAIMHVTGMGSKRTKHSVLAINYIGELDKPISPIVISDSEAGAEWYRSAVLKLNKSRLAYLHGVSGTLLQQLIAEAELFERTVRSEEKKTSKSGKTVSVTIITPQKNSTFLLDTESTVSLLDKLQKHCPENESLRADLAHFQRRIRF